MKSTCSILIDRFPLQMVRHLLFIVVAVGSSQVSSAKSDPPARPGFSKVAQAVENYFHSQPDQQRSDLLSQRQVRAALAQVIATGWQVQDQDKIVDRALADNSFVVREFSTPEGRTFMRRIAQQPGAYGRLDRLSTLQNGQDTIRTLIQQKQGEDFITYLATTSGGKNLGKMMAGTKGGVDLNKPTGRIYTEDELLTALKQLYNATP